ncbi:hypothetical protein O7606_04860 [Micromonospora sp. WMMD882]|nr:hypothetical protein [Micromonospora sp. WMMD882]WBB82587.1 hypothetical protein O7606_04860 [Micromonospora sp. WMMD882]
MDPARPPAGRGRPLPGVPGADCLAARAARDHLASVADPPHGGADDRR